MYDYDSINPMVDPNHIFDLTDRTALIIGGAGIMGREFSRTLALAGCNVIIADLDPSKGKQIVRQLQADYSVTAHFSACDVTNKDDLESVFQNIKNVHGPLDILIYNVMAKPRGYYAPLDEYQLETWDKVLAGNLTGAFFACREASRHMASTVTGGSIILTASTYGVVGPDQRIYDGLSANTNIYESEFPLNTPASYSVSKAGLIGLVHHMATTLGEHQIRVNALTPGGIYDNQHEDFHNKYVERTCLRRMAVSSDYNGAILFLASDASRYMTGSNLIIDGGWTAW
jgi:NAD(P)-dependent dehydrogenase (short-subunit alcohol dehydrogenase family)